MLAQARGNSEAEAHEHRSYASASLCLMLPYRVDRAFLAFASRADSDKTARRKRVLFRGRGQLRSSAQSWPSLTQVASTRSQLAHCNAADSAGRTALRGEQRCIMSTRSASRSAQAGMYYAGKTRALRRSLSGMYHEEDRRASAQACTIRERRAHQRLDMQAAGIARSHIRVRRVWKRGGASLAAGEACVSWKGRYAGTQLRKSTRKEGKRGQARAACALCSSRLPSTPSERCSYQDISVWSSSYS
jgi:hypothetical protein